MNQEYSLGGDIASVTGGDVEVAVKDFFAAHYFIALALIVVLVIVVIWQHMKLYHAAPSVEKFSPGTLAKHQVVSLSGGEAMSSSLEDIYKDADCNNPQRAVAPDDAWSWMTDASNMASANRSMTDAELNAIAAQQKIDYANKATGEHMKGKKTDAALSRVISGY